MNTKLLLFCFVAIAVAYAYQRKGQVARNPVSSHEIKKVSLELWNLDVNRAGPDDVIVNLQASLRYGVNEDRSSEPFYTYVNPDVLERPTFRSLVALLDNYQREQGRPESVTSEERDEVNQFLDQVLSTSVGRRLYEFLSSKDLAGSGGLAGFKHQLNTMWFHMYSRRNRVQDSCGFEHVFVGEVRDGQVEGFHNWIQFYLEEQRGNLNYHGLVKHREPQIYGANFNWHDNVKPLGGMMVGSSPELEFALITLCHLTRPNQKCWVKLNDRHASPASPINVPIQTWQWSRGYSPGNGLKFISSGFFRS